MMALVPHLILATATAKWVVSGVFLLLVLLLVKLPTSVRSMLAEDTQPWWKRTRWWAIAIATAQALVYLIFG